MAPRYEMKCNRGFGKASKEIFATSLPSGSERWSPPHPKSHALALGPSCEIFDRLPQASISLKDAHANAGFAS